MVSNRSHLLHSFNDTNIQLLFLLTTVIKPGLTRQVNPGSGGWTGPGLIKDRL
jgi:hypothetical protein